MFRSAFFLNRFDNLFWTFPSFNLHSAQEHKCHTIPSDNTISASNPFSSNIFWLISDFLIAAKPEASPDLGRPSCYRQARAQVEVEQCTERRMQKNVVCSSFFFKSFIMIFQAFVKEIKANTFFWDRICWLPSKIFSSSFRIFKILPKKVLRADLLNSHFPFCRLRVLSIIKTDWSWME